jgi:hypothetical protein
MTAVFTVPAGRRPDRLETTAKRGRSRRSRRFRLRAGVAAAAAILGSVATAMPASAAHGEVSQHTPSLGAAARTVYASSIDYNLNELGLGCPRNHRAQFHPTWRLSNVTSSSVYIDYLKIRFVPSRNARLTWAYLVDGNVRTHWQGNWAEPSVDGSITRTFYFRRTVPWGRARMAEVVQTFGFNSDSASVCNGDKQVTFRLRRP